MYPLKFKPIFKDRIWGGDALKSFFSKDIPQNTKIGESWELADVGNDKSIITNGEFAGQSIAELVEKYPLEITGDPAYEPPFPLLIKILDAQDTLSVQVHPDEQTCIRTGKGDLKTECWYIIDAKPGAVIYKGLKPDVTKQQFAKAIQDGTTADLPQKIPVEPGQCHFLPAGTAHAIGAGLLIAEIQTPSDTTYRVFDWNRVDDNGNPRQLHIEDALQSINFNQDPAELTATTVGRLVECEYFNVDKGHQLSGCEMLLSKGKMVVLFFISGNGTIADNDSSVEYEAGDTILIPADYQGIVRFAQETKYLTITID